MERGRGGGHYAVRRMMWTPDSVDTMLLSSPTRNPKLPTHRSNINRIG